MHKLELNPWCITTDFLCYFAQNKESTRNGIAVSGTQISKSQTATEINNINYSHSFSIAREIWLYRCSKHLILILTLQYLYNILDIQLSNKKAHSSKTYYQMFYYSITAFPLTTNTCLTLLDTKHLLQWCKKIPLLSPEMGCVNTCTDSRWRNEKTVQLVSWGHCLSTTTQTEGSMLLCCRISEAQLLAAVFVSKESCAVHYLLCLQPEAECQRFLWIHGDGWVPSYTEKM